MTCKLTDRREFMKTAGAVAAGVVLGTVAHAQAETKLPQTTIPRWRGFNLIDFFQAFGRGERSAGMVSEDDLRWIRDWGFDFIRLPWTTGSGSIRIGARPGHLRRTTWSRSKRA